MKRPQENHLTTNVTQDFGGDLRRKNPIKENYTKKRGGHIPSDEIPIKAGRLLQSTMRHQHGKGKPLSEQKESGE